MQVVNTPIDYVRALTCGMTQRERERRCFCMLRAHVDESGSSSRSGVFVMTGLVAFNYQWESLVGPWDSILKEGTVIPYFHMTEMRLPEWREKYGLSPEEGGAKTAALAKCITYPPMLFSVCVSIQKDDYRSIVTDSGILRRLKREERLWLNTPYNYCFQQIVGRTLEKIVDKLNIVGDVVDFVFDRNHPLFEAAETMLNELRSGPMPPGWKETLGDANWNLYEKLIPLQAADMLAGTFMEYCSNPNDEITAAGLLSISGSGDNNITLHVKPDRLRRLVNDIRHGNDWKRIDEID